MMSKLFSLFTFSFILVAYVATQGIINDACLNPYCRCTVQPFNELICDNFTNYKSLNFSLTKGRLFQGLELIPKINLTLNSSLSLFGLNLPKSGTVHFKRLNWIDVTYAPFKGNTMQNEPDEVIISNSLINFENDVASDCYNKKPNGVQVFSNLQLFLFEFNNVELNRKMCPSMFSNSKIIEMYFNETNIMEAFFEEPASSSIDYNVHVREVYIENPLGLEIKKKLNKQMFSKIEWFQVSNTALMAIHEDFFTDFKELKSVRLIVSLGLLLQTDSKWMKSINKGIDFDIDNKDIDSNYQKKIASLYIEDAKAAFLDKQFCELRHFPHRQLVFPLLGYSSAAQCTCTTYFLFKNYKKFLNLPDFNVELSNLPMKCLNISNIDAVIKNCNFEQRIKDCEKPSSNAVKTFQLFSYLTLSISIIAAKFHF